MLEADGTLFIRVPNQSGLLSRVMKNRWYAIIPLHLSYFTKKLLCRELKKRNMHIAYASAPLYLEYFTYLSGMVRYAFKKLLLILRLSNNYCLKQSVATNDSESARRLKLHHHLILLFRHFAWVS